MTGKKKKLTILVDEDVIQRAKDSGLNLSIIAEKAYIKTIKAIESVFDEKNPESSPLSSSKYKVVGGAGIEPATLATSRRCHTTRPPAQPRDKGSG